MTRPFQRGPGGRWACRWVFLSILFMASWPASTAYPAAGGDLLDNGLVRVVALKTPKEWSGVQIRTPQNQVITEIHFGPAAHLTAHQVDRGQDARSQWLRFQGLTARPTPRLGKGSYVTVRLYLGDPYPQISFRLELRQFDKAAWEKAVGRLPFHFLTCDATGAEVFHQRGWPIGTPVVDPYILHQCQGPGQSIVSTWSSDWTYAPPLGAYPLPTVGAWTKSARKYAAYDFHSARLKDHTERNVASAYCYRLSTPRSPSPPLSHSFFTLVWPAGSPYNALRYPAMGDVVATHFRLLYHLNMAGEDDPNLFVNEYAWRVHREEMPDVETLNDLSWLPAAYRPRTFSPPEVPRLWSREGDRPQWWQPHALIPGGEGWDVSGIDYAYEQGREADIRQLWEDVVFILKYRKEHHIEGDPCVFWERPLQGDGADFFGPGVRTERNFANWSLGRALLHVYQNELKRGAAPSPLTARELLPILDGVLRFTRHILYTRNDYPDVPAAQFAWSAAPAARFCLEYHYAFRDDPQRQELAALALKLARSMTYRYLALWASDNDPSDHLDASFFMEPNAGLEWLGAACANEVWGTTYAIALTYVATGDPILGHYLRGMLERWHELFRDEYYETLDSYGGAFTERYGLFPGARQPLGTRASYGGLWGGFEQIAVPILDSRVRVLCGEGAALAFNLGGKHTTIADYRYARDGNFSFRLVPFVTPSPAPRGGEPTATSARRGRERYLDVTVTFPCFDLRNKTVQVQREGEWVPWGPEKVQRFPERPDTLYLKDLHYGDTVRVGEMPLDAPVLACALAKPRQPGGQMELVEGFTLVDLRRACNQATSRDWSDPRSLAGFEPGRKWLYGIPFAFVDPDLNGGRASVRDATVQVNRRARRVFAVVGQVADNARLTITIDSGRKAQVPLKSQLSLRLPPLLLLVPLEQRVVACTGWPPLFGWQLDLATVSTGGGFIRSVRAEGCDLYALTLTRKTEKALQEPLQALAQARAAAVALRQTLAGLRQMEKQFEAFSGHIGILPTAPPESPQTGPFVKLLRQAGLLKHVRILTAEQLVDRTVFNARNIWLALFLGGEKYIQTVHQPGDGDTALVRYLHEGGTLLCVPNQPFPFYYNERDQVVVSAPKFGLPICGSGAEGRLDYPPTFPPSKGEKRKGDFRGWETPPPGRKLTFTLHPQQNLLKALPPQLPFPEEGDLRWRPIVNVVGPANHYVPLISLHDDQGTYYGDGGALIEYHTGPLAGGRVLYLWCTLTHNPDYYAGILTDVLSYFLKHTLPPPAEQVCWRALSPLTIDGVLDEETWQQAVPMGPFRCFLTKQGKPLYATEAKCAWDDQHLYFAFVAEDPDIWSHYTQRDQNLWEEEVVEVYIDPDGDGKNYKEFEVNPRNAVVDLNIPQGIDIGDVDEARKWDAVHLQAAVRANGTINQRDDIDESWTVELALAWGDLTPAGAPPKIGEVWRVQLYRIDRSKMLPDPEKQEFSGWSPTDTFHHPIHFGRLVFGGNPFREDFSLYPDGSDGFPTWTVQSGTWRVEEGVYVGRDSGTDGWQPSGARTGDAGWENYRLRLRFQVRERGSDHRDGAWIGIRCGSDGSGYSLHLTGGSATLHKAYQGRSTSDTEMLGQVPWTPDRAWHDLAITVQGNHLGAELDGRLLLEATDDHFLGVPPVPVGGIVLSARKWTHSTGHTVVAFDEVRVEVLDREGAKR